MWLAARTNDEPIPSAFGIRTSDLRNTSGGRFYNYMATLAIGHFVAQLFGYDHPYDSDWSRRGPLEDSLVQIWPVREPVTWPPPVLVTSLTTIAEDPGFEDEVTRVFRAHGQEVQLGKPRTSVLP